MYSELGEYVCVDCLADHCQVLVHGEQNEMARLKAALLREHEDNEVCCQGRWASTVHETPPPSPSPPQDLRMEIYNPRNTQAVELYFRQDLRHRTLSAASCLTAPLALLQGREDGQGDGEPGGRASAGRPQGLGGADQERVQLPPYRTL